MRRKQELIFIIRRLIHRRSAEQELDEEIRAHLEMEIEQNIADGMSPEEARLAAQRSFGSVALSKEDSRAMWGLRSLETLWQDLRYGARILLKRPGFTSIAIVTLALGIGVNTTIFSIANSILLQPLPIKDADRVIDVRSYTTRENRPQPISYSDYLELRKRTGEVVDLFSASGAILVLGVSGADSNTRSVGEEEKLFGLFVTGNYFSMLGGNARLGRTLAPEDDQAGAHPVVVLSHRFWQRRFGAAPEIVGQTILINRQAFTVVGVAEERFRGVARKAPDVWAPWLMRDQINAGDRPSNIMGRLQPGAQLQQAEAALTNAYTHLLLDRSGSVRDPRIQAYPAPLRVKLDQASSLDRESREVAMPALSVILGAVTLVLLIACLNIAGLMLARMAARQREIAVRLSLGASHVRVLRQLFTEGLLLAGVGGLAALLLSRWATRALSLWMGADDPGIALDWRVMAYALGISAFTAVVIGLLPAWQCARVNLVSALKQEAAGFNQPLARFPLRGALVVGQIAFSLVLLLGAGLFARTLLSVMTFDPGFETKNLSSVELGFGAPGSPHYDDTRAAQFQRELQERLLTTPMVKYAVWFSSGPLNDSLFNGGNSTMYGTDGPFSIVGPNDSVAIVNGGTGIFAGSNHVSPNYFAALGIPLLYGRTFTELEDRDEGAVVIINEALARRHWPGEYPVGKPLWTESGRKEIIGVAKDMRNAANEPFLYLPLQRRLRLGLQLLVRSAAPPTALAATLRATIQSIDPKLNPYVQQLDDSLKDRIGPLQVATTLAGLLGVLALAMAVMGLYGVTALAVVQRTHEIGVRMALGARCADVVRLVLRQGLRLVIIGLAIGLLLSTVATRVLAAVVPARMLAAALLGINPTDLPALGGATFLLGLVALVACWVPARRATRVDPMVALRCE
ncbi:MAG TPA: ABC transporter permease [Blastocatellia bacterium]|jgi:predicted permease|nr:ABC transporter permease [Blastocatellia bacterium]